jgi:hypothetical protein
VNFIDEGTFVIGLKGVYLAVAGCCLAFYLLFDLGKSNRAIYFGFPFTESIEVRAVE